MSLVKCPECNHDISDRCRSCPQCGYILKIVCPECGSSVPGKTKACPHCGYPFIKEEASPAVIHDNKLDNHKPIWVIVVCASIIVFLMVFLTIIDKPVRFTQQTTHKAPKYPSSAYYDNVNNDLSLSDIKVSSNSSYTTVTGTIKNNGSTTFSFVKVKGAFQDRSGLTIDTDWTYAVGSEGLAPGETSSFQMSVDKNSRITKCECSVYDYKSQ